MVEQWLVLEGRAADPSRSEEQREQDATAATSARAELDVLASEIRKRVTPFHWWIEFPEVFFEERPDPLQEGAVNGAALMEGVVGNPPFAGKNMIAAGHPDGYIAWLLTIHAESHGNADLCAHFFRRAADLVGRHGAFGLIGTNTIAQGDTRRTSLQPLLAAELVVYRAEEDVAWPGDAAVVVTLLHLALGVPVKAVGGHATLNDARVVCINSFLRARKEAAEARAFSEYGKSLVGSFRRRGVHTGIPARRKVSFRRIHAMLRSSGGISRRGLQSASLAEQLALRN
jgi:hypothetical protein